MAKTVASLKNVSIERNGSTLLRGVSLDVNQGETLLITGPSGSGKSTIVRALAGIETLDAGDAQLLGESIGSMRKRQLNNLKRGRVAVGFQTPRVDGGLTVSQNLFTLAELVHRGGEDRIAERAGRLAVQFEIAHKLEQMAGTLSGGEKQRLAMAQILMGVPEVVLLDEPSSMIDPQGKQDFLRDLTDATMRDALAQDPATTVVMVSHDEQARDFAHREIVVNSGEIVAEQIYASQPR